MSFVRLCTVIASIELYTSMPILMTVIVDISSAETLTLTFSGMVFERDIFENVHGNSLCQALHVHIVFADLDLF